MLPTPYEHPEQQYDGRAYLQQPPASSFINSPGRAEFHQLRAGDPRQLDEASSSATAADWSGSGSGTRRSSEGGAGDGDEADAEHRTGLPIKKASTVNRSAMACTLCRKQKMKCEGKDKAPCRRCRMAGVECTFEAAAPAPAGLRKGAAASKEWIETRMAGVETRLKKLENRQSSTSSSTSNSTTAPPSPTTNTPSAGALEARIAQLESQVYALTMAAAANATAAPSTPQSASFSGPPQPRIPQHHHYQPSAYPSSTPYGAPSHTSYSMQHPQSSTSTNFADFHAYPTPDLDFHNSPPPPPSFYPQYQGQPAPTGYPPVEQQQRWGVGGVGDGGQAQRSRRGGGP